MKTSIYKYLSEEIVNDILSKWNEPHRYYHNNQLSFIKDIKPDTKVLYIPCDKKYEHISSSAIRNLIKFDELLIKKISTIMDLYRIKLFDVSKISFEDGTYIDMHDENYFPDTDENITYIKSDIIDDYQYIFLLSDSYKIEKLINILNGKVRYDIENITSDFIKYKDIEGLNLIDDKSFFNNYKLNYLSIDNILDKINEHGIDNLDEIDIKILKKEIK